MIGQTISHYKITEKLGEGGMGVVYKAEDTQLRRAVALKFLTQQGLSDPETKARLIREAQAAASLDHPHICSVYGIHEEGGRTFIAMAYVNGMSLADKIKQRPLSIEEALHIATQMGEGLQEAHEQGVVHRDIKPANIMLTRKGQVKIMDFGLAYLASRSKLTRSGTTLGTPVYMSPEQALGQPADRRSDIWSLGVVLYEMLAGEPPFNDEHSQAIVYSILNEAPEPLTARRTGLPVEIDRVIGKVLAKKPDERYQHVDDLTVDLKNLREKPKPGQPSILRTSAGDQHSTSVGTEASTGVGARHAAGTEAGITDRAQHAAPLQPTWKRYLPWAVAAVMALAFVSVAFVHFAETPPTMPSPRRFSFTPESLQTGPQTRVNRAFISPNGRYIVYATAGESGKLWVRDLDREEPRALEGTEGGFQPFWSPDSEFIGFVTEKDVRKVAVQGGPAITLCALPGPIRGGGAWSPDGETIVFSSGNNFPVLHEVPARSGTPKLLFEPEKSEKGPGNITPHFLPPTAAARSVLFGLGSATNRDVAIKNLMTGELRVLASGAFPAYSPSGHILYQTAPGEGGLWALPFSIETLQATGEAFPIAQNAANPSVAQDGTLVYTDLSGTGLNQLVWRDRGGARLQAIGAPQTSMTIQFALSPDGGRVSLLDASRDIWVHDLGSAVKTRLTSDESLENYPLWSSTGREIAFASNRSSDRRSSFSIFSIPADGAGEPALLVGSELNEYPSDWSRDGRHLIYTADSGGPGGLDIWYLRRKPDGNGFESVPFLEGRFNQQSGKLSPDGRFLAYCSDDSGRSEVYVRPFPEGGGQWPVSPAGGCDPRWSHDGKELFYVVGNTLMTAAVTTSAGFSAGAVVRLFQDASLAQGRNRYDVSADGKRFLMIEQVQGDEAKAPAIHIVQNWFEEFRQRQRE